MPRSIVLSNGYLAVCLDQDGFLRDLFYPHVGLENHVSGYKHRLGIMVDGYFSWLDTPEWNVTASYDSHAMVGYVTYVHETMPITIRTEDVVYNELPVFLRHFKVENSSATAKDIKMFFGQEFAIGEVRLRNTAFYDPTKNALIHYKGRRVFLVNGQSQKGGIDDYTIGMFKFEGKEGSWRDAEDGELSKNAVEHGPVDSVVRLCASCGPNTSTDLYYWICAAESIDDVQTLNEVVRRKTPEAMLYSTKCFWEAWAHSHDIKFPDLPQSYIDLYYASLFVLRSHVDHDGGIMASLDSDMLLHGKDSYSYVWPRDAAYIAMILDKAGYTSVTEPFFQFCRDVIHPDGYLHHKFQADKSLGSTWQSNIKQTDWLEDKILQLPIQEDETATVLYSLWNHFLYTRDVEFVEMYYKPLVERAANFMVAFRDKNTGLPIHSYDLWEEVTGVSTYTCCSVVGGLRAAASICELLGKENHAKHYRRVADEVIVAMRKHLFDPERQAFVRVAFQKDGTVSRDTTLDMSALYGLWYYDVLPADDPQFVSTLRAVQEHLSVPVGIGGYVRYENDQYYRDQSTGPNPWIITTLWEVQRELRAATTHEQLKVIMTRVQWAVDRMGDAPVLAEQFHPLSGEPRSVMPLAWSHAVYIETILMYLERLEALGIHDSCVPVKAWSGRSLPGHGTIKA